MNIKQHLSQIKESQKYKKRLDLVRSFTATAGVSDSANIALPSEGYFEQTGYNIIYSKNSIINGANTNRVKIRFRSRAENDQQSNDLIPIQLISTPGAEDMARYGERSFFHLYEKNDSLLIDWDNREAVTAPDIIHDEEIKIIFSGWIYLDI